MPRSRAGSTTTTASNSSPFADSGGISVTARASPTRRPAVGERDARLRQRAGHRVERVSRARSTPTERPSARSRRDRVDDRATTVRRRLARGPRAAASPTWRTDRLGQHAGRGAREQPVREVEHRRRARGSRAPAPRSRPCGRVERAERVGPARLRAGRGRLREVAEDRHRAVRAAPGRAAGAPSPSGPAPRPPRRDRTSAAAPPTTHSASSSSARSARVQRSSPTFPRRLAGTAVPARSVEDAVGRGGEQTRRLPSSRRTSTGAARHRPEAVAPPRSARRASRSAATSSCSVGRAAAARCSWSSARRVSRARSCSRPSRSGTVAARAARRGCPARRGAGRRSVTAGHPQLDLGRRVRREPGPRRTRRSPSPSAASPLTRDDLGRLDSPAPGSGARRGRAASSGSPPSHRATAAPAAM